MVDDDDAPTYVAHVVEEAGGFRTVVTLNYDPVHQGQVCADRAAARQEAALFVILRPEDRRNLVWASDEPVWRGDEQVGCISLEEPLGGRDWVVGWFRPGPLADSFRALLEATLDLKRRWHAGENDVLGTFEANCVEIAAFGLSVGQPPRAITSVDPYGHWYLAITMSEQTPAEPGAAADGGA